MQLQLFNTVLSTKPFLFFYWRCQITGYIFIHKRNGLDKVYGDFLISIGDWKSTFLMLNRVTYYQCCYFCGKLL